MPIPASPPEGRGRSDPKKNRPVGQSIFTPPASAARGRRAGRRRRARMRGARPCRTRGPRGLRARARSEPWAARARSRGDVAWKATSAGRRHVPETGSASFAAKAAGAAAPAGSSPGRAAAGSRPGSSGGRRRGRGAGAGAGRRGGALPGPVRRVDRVDRAARPRPRRGPRPGLRGRRAGDVGRAGRGSGRLPRPAEASPCAPVAARRPAPATPWTWEAVGPGQIGVASGSGSRRSFSVAVPPNRPRLMFETSRKMT